MRIFTSSLSVLVVDDLRDAADSLADILRAFGHEARTAYTPTEAVIAVGDFAPDVILMDIGIPGLDGYRLARKLCGLLDRRPLLVAVTGCGGLEERSREEGFDHHFLKPADPQELLDVLHAATGEADWAGEPAHGSSSRELALWRGRNAVQVPRSISRETARRGWIYGSHPPKNQVD
jgi:DNA-binding response OmpR family regulator